MNTLLQININCDMGEGIGNDEAIMPYIHAANIACGYHAGDEDSIKKCIALAIKNKVAIGAHPSFPDKEYFGRRDLSFPLPEIYDMVVEQIKLVQELAKAAGTTLSHVKLHGALYNMAARSKEMADVVALAIKDVDEDLLVYSLSGWKLISSAKKIGLKTKSEVFADRTYTDDGRLTPRKHPEALLDDPKKVVQQVLQMATEGTVTAVSGKKVPILAETYCLHGDGEHAVDFAKAIHKATT